MLIYHNIFLICFGHSFTAMQCMFLSHRRIKCHPVFFYFKCKAVPVPPSDVWILSLLQESRINCIRIARKGRSTPRPQTLRPQRHLCTTSFLFRPGKIKSVLIKVTFICFIRHSQSVSLAFVCVGAVILLLFSSGPVRKGQHAGRD